MSASKVPRRVTKPDEYKYISLDKKRFAELIRDFLAAIEKQVEQSPRVTISIEGFDGSFESVEDFVNTVTTQEWERLSRIYVYFYDEAEPKYERRLALRLTSTYSPGLEIEYGNKGKDAERLAVKENVGVFINGYVRRIPALLSDRVISFFTAVVVSTGLIIWFYHSASPESLEKLTVLNHVTLIIFILWGAFFLVYLPINFFHHKLIPYFEATDETTKTRLQSAWTWIKNIGVILGILSVLVAIWQTVFS